MGHSLNLGQRSSFVCRRASDNDRNPRCGLLPSLPWGENGYRTRDCLDARHMMRIMDARGGKALPPSVPHVMAANARI
jgi:hypothetical protein